MSELVLSPEGLKKARTQYRVFEYMRLLVQAAERDPTAYRLTDDNRDRYLGDVIERTDILLLVLQAAGEDIPDPLPERSDGESFSLTFPEALGSSSDGSEALAPLPTRTPAEAYSRYQFYMERMSAIAPDPLHPPPRSPGVETYFQIIECIFQHLINLESLDSTPSLDWNDDRFMASYQPGKEEVKLVISLDPELMQVYNINAELTKEPTPFSNGLWFIHVLNFLANISFQMITLTFPYYVTALGGSASDTTNLTTFFNLLQLVCSPLWLWLSEKIGRKPIFIGIMAWNMVFLLIAAFVPYYFVSSDATPAQIAASAPRQISLLLGIRAIMGVAALINPLCFTICADLATPKTRPQAMYYVNIFNQVGSVVAALIVSFAMTVGSRYGCADYSCTRLSYRDTCLIGVGVYALATVMTCFFKESCPGYLARRELARLRKAADKAGKCESANDSAGGPAKQSGRPTRPDGTRMDSWWNVFCSLSRNKDIVILFFSYILQLSQSCLLLSSNSYVISKFYGMTGAQEARQWAALATLICILVSLVIIIPAGKYLNRWIGEVRTISVSLYVAMIPAILRFAIDTPVPKWVIALPFNTIALVLGDATFIQFASIYATPQNRGTLLGVFQIGNSLGRIIGALVSGVMYDWSWRDASFLFTVFGAASLILLSVATPPLERPEMDAVAQKMEEVRLEEGRV